MSTKKPFPTFPSEAEYDKWLQSADLTEYDTTGFRETNVEAMIKNRSVTLRMPEYLFAALRARARKTGIPYQRLMRMAIERDLARKARD
jgi:predicted DNA binding CopG/RHH family protein